MCAIDSLAAWASHCELNLHEMANNARLAQSAERKALNLVVVGSSPTVGALLFANV